MKLIVILICFALQRYWRPQIALHSRHWLERYLASLLARIKPHTFISYLIFVFILIVPFALVAGIIDFSLHGLFYNLFTFIFNLLVLWYCLDASDIRNQLKDFFRAAEAGNLTQAQNLGEEYAISNRIAPGANVFRAVTRAIFLRADQHIFGILFWYIVLGPVGAVLYYLVDYLVDHRQLLAEEPKVILPSLLRLQGILDWLPNRLTGLTYALVGHFGYAFSRWIEHLTAGLNQSRELTYLSGLEALELDHSNEESANIHENSKATHLIDRAIVVWIVMIAIFTLGAVIS